MLGLAELAGDGFLGGASTSMTGPFELEMNRAPGNHLGADGASRRCPLGPAASIRASVRTRAKSLHRGKRPSGFFDKAMAKIRSKPASSGPDVSQRRRR